MPEAKYQRDTQLFDCLGLDLNRPVDSVKTGKFPFLKNVRAFQAGRVEPRDGLTSIANAVTNQTPVHSARRLNDHANNAFSRIIGTGTHLAYGQASFSDAGDLFSGNPLAMVPFRSDDSPASFMYIGDSTRMRKIDAAATANVHPIGLNSPNTPPLLSTPGAQPTSGIQCDISVPQYKIIDDFDATTGWTNAGTAGAPALLSSVASYRTTSTISQILYDSGTTGWACVSLASMVGVGAGESLLFNPGGGTSEGAIVESVHANAANITIGSILYESGSTGFCSISITTSVSTGGFAGQIQVEDMIRDTSVGENIRVLAVIDDQAENVCIRAFTVGTFAAGDTLQTLASFRVYLANNHANGETVRTDGVRTAVTAGVGTLSKTSALDLSLIASGLPSHLEDYMHISIRVSDASALTQIRILLDVDVSTNDFAHNYFSYTSKATDFTLPINVTHLPVGGRFSENRPAPTGGIPATVQLTTGQLVSALISPVTGATYSATGAFLGTAVDQITIAGQLYTNAIVNGNTLVGRIVQPVAPGLSQWTEFHFRLADLNRFGTDQSRSLANVAAIRIEVTATASINVDLDSWWIGGGYGPDVGANGIPYIYRYRARIPTTGVQSNWSQPLRGGLTPKRQAITVRLQQYTAALAVSPSDSNVGNTLATSDFVLDIQRFGGQIAEWHYVGTASNGSSVNGFTDIYTDDVVAKQPTEGQDNWQPWPVIDLPKSGTSASSGVSGTLLKDVGTNFNLSWAPGNSIKVNGVPYTVYRVISTSILEVFENMGNQSSVGWKIDEPLLMGQALPCLWGDPEVGVMFACGDTKNPGRLYWSNYLNPDSTTDKNFLNVTAPSEELQNGVIYNQRSYVFSTERYFQVRSNGQDGWVAEQIPGEGGLFSRWAITREPAPFIAFLTRTGINVTTGGQSIPITDAELYPIFPNEANAGVTTNGVVAPDMTQTSKLRLGYYDEILYFDYQTSGTYYTLVFFLDLGAMSRGEAPGGWFWDNYTPGVVFHYGEEGPAVNTLLVGGSDATTGKLYQYTGNSDAGTGISCSILTPSRDQNDKRGNKFYGDMMLDSNTASINVTATPKLNNNATSLTAITVNTAARAQTAITLSTGAVGSAVWQTAKNISLQLDFTVSTSSRPFFFIWEPRWTFESAPISALSWEISPSTFGMYNYKSLGFYRVTHVSSADFQIIVTVDGVAQSAITIANGAGAYTTTVGRFPVYKGKLYKLRIANAAQTSEFRLDTRDTYFEVKHWGAEGPYERLRLVSDYAAVEG